WWYGMIGNNEFEDAWMDEGFNTFSAARAEATAYDPTYFSLRYFGGFIPLVFKDIVMRRETDNNGWAAYRLMPKREVTSSPTHPFFPAQTAPMSYSKTALWLNTLERYLGWPTLQHVMATYFSRWRFKHPRPNDFFNTVADVAKRDMGWFFDQTYRSSDVFD